MKLKSALTGVTNFSDIQCQKAISHVLIVKVGAAGIVDEKINIILQDGSNQRKLTTNQKIRDVAILSQFGEGYLSQTVSAGSVKSAYLLKLNETVGVEVADKCYLSIDLNALVAGSTYEVYGIECPVTERTFYSYNTTSIVGDEAQEKQYSVNPTAQLLGIRNNGALSKITVTYNNGQQVSYLPEELAAVTREMNDITQASDVLVEGDAVNQTILGGAAEMYHWPLQGVQKFDISTVGGTELVFFVVNKESF